MGRYDAVGHFGRSRSVVMGRFQKGPAGNCRALFVFSGRRVVQRLGTSLQNWLYAGSSPATPANGGIAQLVERSAHNREVAGSKPAPATRFELCSLKLRATGRCLAEAHNLGGWVRLPGPQPFLLRDGATGARMAHNHRMAVQLRLPLPD